MTMNPFKIISVILDKLGTFEYISLIISLIAGWLVAFSTQDYSTLTKAATTALIGVLVALPFAILIDILLRIASEIWDRFVGSV